VPEPVRLFRLAWGRGCFVPFWSPLNRPIGPVVFRSALDLSLFCNLGTYLIRTLKPARNAGTFRVASLPAISLAILEIEHDRERKTRLP
jgi:hypothetical protein